MAERPPNPVTLAENRRLSYATAVVLLALGLTGLLSLGLMRRALTERILQGQADSARQAGGQVAALLETRLHQLEAVLRLPGFRASVLAGDCRAMRARLEPITQTDPFVERTAVVDAAGRFLCASPDSPQSRGADLSDMDWYQGGARKGEPFVSVLFRRRLPPRKLVIALSATLKIQGRMVAHLVTLLDQEVVGSHTSRSTGQAVREALLVDPAGHLVGFQTPGNEEGMADFGALPLVREALAGRAGRGTLRDPRDGAVMLAAAEPVPLSGRNWAMLVLQPRSDALAAVRSLSLRLGLLGLLGVSLAAAGLLVLVRARRRAAGLAELLEDQNQELAQQAEELRQANEELTAQSEELAAQADELGQANEELQQQTDSLEAANEELERLRDGLERTVAERSTELRLREAAFQQSQKMEAIGRLAGGVAHDFNNLLTVVLGYANLLKSGPQDGRTLANGLGEIEAAAQRGGRLTQQLLAFARRQSLQTRPTDVGALVEGLLPMLKRVVPSSLVFKTRHGAGVPAAQVDPGQLEQILLNLVINARDAMPHGGTVDISTAEAVVSEAVGEGDERLAPGRYVLLEVRDSGEGMAKAVLERIFEPFFTTKEPGKGSGLGLSMVHGAIRQAGGQVFAFSNPGQGAVFKLYLPASAGAAAAEAPAAPASAAGGSERVLLVEDNAALREMAALLLGQAGYTVVKAGDPAEALARLAEPGPGPDLLVTDLVMPGASGLDLARRATLDRPDLPVLFISGYSEAPRPGPEDRLRWSFLTKPFSRSALLTALRELLDRRD